MKEEIKQMIKKDLEIYKELWKGYIITDDYVIVNGIEMASIKNKNLVEVVANWNLPDMKPLYYIGIFKIPDLITEQVKKEKKTAVQLTAFYGWTKYKVTDKNIFEEILNKADNHKHLCIHLYNGASSNPEKAIQYLQ